MTNIWLASFLGRGVGELLKLPSFSRWCFTRTVAEDLPEKEIRYEFEGHGVEFICDDSDRIGTIFLHRGDGEALSEISFLLSRREVMERFGAPSKSGRAARDPVLGDHGAWDRYSFLNGTIHFQYQFEKDAIEMITLMRADVVP